MTTLFQSFPQFYDSPPPIFVFQFISTLFREIFFSPPTFAKFPSDFVKCTCFTYFACISIPPTFTMMHLCITQCTYWTPLLVNDDETFDGCFHCMSIFLKVSG